MSSYMPVQSSASPTKNELKKLNAELATLSNDFTTKLLAATKAAAYVTTDRAALTGLSDAQINAAAEAAKARKVEGFVVALQNTTQQPDLVYVDESRYAGGAVLELVESRGTRRRQRYA